MRKGVPQGDHHRERRQHAQEDRDRGPNRDREPDGGKGEPAAVGEGKERVAGQ